MKRNLPILSPALKKMNAVAHFAVLKGLTPTCEANWLSVPFVMIALALCAGFGRAEEAGLKIAVIPKGTTHVFWKSVHAGADAAAKELGVEAVWQGPAKEDDRRMQIEVVQNFTSQKVGGIVLAPLDDQALKDAAESAVKSGIKVVIIDSGLRSDQYSSFVATDNFIGGKLAGKRLAEVMGGQGKALMLRYAEGSASTTQREEGFLEALKELKGIEVVSSNQYAGTTAGEAMKKADTLLLRFPGVNGIFCPNESSTFGMLQALKTQGLAGKIKFVGFDANDPLLQGLKNGEIHGLTVQNPFKMGYLGVKTVVAAIKGQKVDKRIDTGCMMVTLDNLKSPEVHDLLNPPLPK